MENIRQIKMANKIINEMAMEKDLFEYLRNKLDLMYISDLKKCNAESLCETLDNMNTKSFHDRQWRDLYAYVVREAYTATDHEDIRQVMIDKLRKKKSSLYGYMPANSICINYAYR